MHEELLRDVVAAMPLGGHRVRLTFDDGLEGDLDLRPIIGEFVGVFAPLADPAEFSRLRVDPNGGTIAWPNGADVDPVVLYCAVKGIPVPRFEAASTRIAASPRPRRTSTRHESPPRADAGKSAATRPRAGKARRTPRR